MQKLAFDFLALLRAQRLQIARALGVEPAAGEADVEWARRVLTMAADTGRLDEVRAMVITARPSSLAVPIPNPLPISNSTGPQWSRY